MDRRALRVSRSLMPVGSGRGRSRRSSRFTPLQHRQLPPARRHILPQRVGVICRPDPEVPVVRCAPQGDDRQDLDEPVPTGEATRRLVTPGARVAVDGNRECIAHPPSVLARDLVRLTVLCGRCSLGDAMPIRLVEGVQRAGARRSAVAGRDVPVKRMTIEAMTADRKTISIRGACALLDVSPRTIYNWMASGKVERVRTAAGSVRIFVDTLWRTPDDAAVSRSDSRGTGVAAGERQAVGRTK